MPRCTGTNKFGLQCGRDALDGSDTCRFHDGTWVAEKTAKVEAAVRDTPVTAWLRAHRAAWAGWPTTKVYDGMAAERRLARLRRYQYPHEVPGCPLQTVAEVDGAVASLRLQHRSNYRKSVEALHL